jgi:hypothetical protein
LQQGTNDFASLRAQSIDICEEYYPEQLGIILQHPTHDKLFLLLLPSLSGIDGNISDDLHQFYPTRPIDIFKGVLLQLFRRPIRTLSLWIITGFAFRLKIAINKVGALKIKKKLTTETN